MSYGASEEEPEVKNMNMDKSKPDAEYTVCWDPLDGSSIVDNNWAVGSMIAIWPSHTGTGDDGMLGATGRDQATSLVAPIKPLCLPALPGVATRHLSLRRKKELRWGDLRRPT